MEEKKYMIPEELMQAYRDGIRPILEKAVGPAHPYTQDDLERAGVLGVIRHLSEHPTVPTGRQIQEMSDAMRSAGNFYQSTEDYCEEWQRRTFLEPEPEVPEEIADLLNQPWGAGVQKAILEAYRRGQKSKGE